MATASAKGARMVVPDLRNVGIVTGEGCPSLVTVATAGRRSTTIHVALLHAADRLVVRELGKLTSANRQEQTGAKIDPKDEPCPQPNAGRTVLRVTMYLLLLCKGWDMIIISGKVGSR